MGGVDSEAGVAVWGGGGVGVDSEWWVYQYLFIYYK